MGSGNSSNQRLPAQPPNNVPNRTSIKAGNTQPTPPPSKTIVLNNDMCIRKKTFEFVKNPKNDREYFLTFKFDAYLPIDISLYYMVNETIDPVHSLTLKFMSLNSSFRAPLSQRFNPGKNIEFPYIFAVNFSETNKEALTEFNENYSPIERIDNPEPKRMFYYLHFEQIDDNYQFNGRSFLVEEIYGINSSGLVNQEANVKDQEKECLICFTDNIDTIIMPCKHMCLCLSCAKALKINNNPQTKKCPICRKGDH